MEFKDIFNPKSPYEWYALLIAIVVILYGSIIEWGIAGAAAGTIIKIARKKEWSTLKKIILVITITISAVLLDLIILLVVYLAKNSYRY